MLTFFLPFLCRLTLALYAGTNAENADVPSYLQDSQLHVLFGVVDRESTGLVGFDDYYEREQRYSAE